MKRKWAELAGDLIKQNGEVLYDDFSTFLQKTADRRNNRFAQELKLPKERRIQEKQESKRVDNYSIQKNQPEMPSELGGCPLCSGNHGVWRCPVFK